MNREVRSSGTFFKKEVSSRITKCADEYATASVFPSTSPSCSFGIPGSTKRLVSRLDSRCLARFNSLVRMPKPVGYSGLVLRFGGQTIVMQQRTRAMKLQPVRLCMPDMLEIQVLLSSCSQPGAIGMRGRFVHEVHIIYLSPPDQHWPQQHHPGHDCDNDYSNIQQHHDDQGTTATPSTTDKDAVDATSCDVVHNSDRIYSANQYSPHDDCQ